MPSRVLNPKTNRYIKKNTQTYRRLVREGVIIPLAEVVLDRSTGGDERSEVNDDNESSKKISDDEIFDILLHENNDRRLLKIYGDFFRNLTKKCDLMIAGDFEDDDED